MSKPDQKSVPNWLLFLFFGTFVFGGLYAIFLHGFLGYDTASRLRAATGQHYVITQIAQIPPRTPAAIANGEQTYNQTCVACHGKNREGGVGPSLADATWLHGSAESEIGKGVLKGFGGASPIPSITGGVMPARGGGNLSDTQVWEVIYYLSSKNASMQQDVKAP